ncbi:hypothetical protein FB451DRAFT_1430273 [Mycena latifolia]|nr:hypothetical protein FB451DRAFT_1430273 [Mycena latifolia]
MLAATHIIPTLCPPVWIEASGGASDAAREGAILPSPSTRRRRVIRLRLFHTPASDSRALHGQVSLADLLALNPGSSRSSIGIAPLADRNTYSPSSPCDPPFAHHLTRPPVSAPFSRICAPLRLGAGSLSIRALATSPVGSACAVQSSPQECPRLPQLQTLPPLLALRGAVAPAPASSSQSLRARLRGEQMSGGASESHAANGRVPYALSPRTRPATRSPMPRGSARAPP